MPNIDVPGQVRETMRAQGLLISTPEYLREREVRRLWAAQDAVIMAATLDALGLTTSGATPRRSAHFDDAAGELQHTLAEAVVTGEFPVMIKASGDKNLGADMGAHQFAENARESAAAYVGQQKAAIRAQLGAALDSGRQL